MTDHRASLEGPHHPRQAPESPLDPGPRDSVSATPRRRPVRTRPISDVSTSSSPTWVETDKGDSSSRDTKAGWATPRRLFKTSTQYSSDPSPLVGATRSTAGFFPKLGRILEGSESKDPRRHRNSVAGVEQHQHQHHQQFTRRRRPAENAPLGRRPIRQKHGSLQRRVESLANLRNPSLISVLSDVTLQSNVSGGSNESSETITQQSYDQAQLAKHKPTRIKKAPQNKGNMPQDGSTTTEAQPAAVFRYMDESLSPEQPQNDEANTARPSTASSSSTASHDPDDDDASSNEENDDPVVESPMTSPASERKPHHDDSCDDSDSVSDLSVREGSPVSNRQPSVSDDVEGSDDEEGGVDDDLQEGSSSSEYSEDEGSDNASATDEVAHQQQQAHHMAIERVPPPRLPSTSSSSRHGDRHTKRLRRQEQALNEHVLQAPQPQREYKKFVGGRSPPNFPPPPAMPMYDPYMHSGASPPAFYATQHAPPPAPPPPTGYYSPPHGPPIPFSPGYEHNLGTAPMGAPNAMVPAPLAHYPAQPPQYQPQPAGPHLTRSTVIGYELVADKLSEGSKSERRRSRGETIVPMYRKFEHLNHRILLHLQDEISELEEELRSLDECIAQYSPRDGAGLIQPASRRGDARLGIELPSRRTELLGRIYVKLGQYNSAFTSFNTMSKEMDAAQPKDIQAYRAWLEERKPIDYAETRFLQHSSDLLAVSRRSANTGGGASSHQSAAIFLPLILVLPLMAFAIVPGLLGRLFILVVIEGGIIKIVMSTKELLELMTPREWTGCVSVYFGFMAVLAALVH